MISYNYNGLETDLPVDQGEKKNKNKTGFCDYIAVSPIFHTIRDTSLPQTTWLQFNTAFFFLMEIIPFVMSMLR